MAGVRGIRKIVDNAFRLKASIDSLNTDLVLAKNNIKRHSDLTGNFLIKGYASKAELYVSQKRFVKANKVLDLLNLLSDEEIEKYITVRIPDLIEKISSEDPDRLKLINKFLSWGDPFKSVKILEL